MEKTFVKQNGEKVTVVMNGKYNYVIDNYEDLGFLTDEIDLIFYLLKNVKNVKKYSMEDEECLGFGEVFDLLDGDLVYTTDKSDYLKDIERTLQNLTEMYYHADPEFEVDYDWLYEQSHIDCLVEFLNVVKEAIKHNTYYDRNIILLEYGVDLKNKTDK